MKCNRLQLSGGWSGLSGCESVLGKEEAVSATDAGDRASAFASASDRINVRCYRFTSSSEKETSLAYEPRCKLPDCS